MVYQSLQKLVCITQYLTKWLLNFDTSFELDVI